MKSQVQPGTIIIAVIVLIVIVAAIWYFTMGRPKAAGDSKTSTQTGVPPEGVPKPQMPGSEGTPVPAPK